jgi:hypothetical protein
MSCAQKKRLTSVRCVMRWMNATASSGFGLREDYSLMAFEH